MIEEGGSIGESRVRAVGLSGRRSSGGRWWEGVVAMGVAWGSEWRL